MHPAFSRIIVIVLDSVGAGELKDASAYGDQGSNTLGNIARQVPLRVPTLRWLGLDRIVDIGEHPTLIGLRWALRRAARMFRGHPEGWRAIQRAGMQRDWSWRRSAGDYLNLYRSLLR